MIRIGVLRSGVLRMRGTGVLKNPGRAWVPKLMDRKAWVRRVDSLLHSEIWKSFVREIAFIS